MVPFEYKKKVSKMPLYGMTLIAGQQKSRKEFPKRLFLGVNCLGIHFLSAEQDIIASFVYENILSWAATRTHFSFIFGDEIKQQKYTIETRKSNELCTLMEAYLQDIAYRSGQLTSWSKGAPTQRQADAGDVEVPLTMGKTKDVRGRQS